MKFSSSISQSLISAAAIVLSLTAAHAADLPSLGGQAGYGGPGVVAGPLTIYDFEPGTYVRAWFEPPLGNRHYYPSSGTAPIIGRKEVLSDRDREPPQVFYRSWSNGPAFRDEMTPDPGFEPVPQK